MQLRTWKELWLDVQDLQDRWDDARKNLDKAKERLSALESDSAQREAPIRHAHLMRKA